MTIKLRLGMTEFERLHGIKHAKAQQLEKLRLHSDQMVKTASMPELLTYIEALMLETRRVVRKTKSKAQYEAGDRG